MNDKPIAITPDGRELFDNAPTVVAILLEPGDGSLIVIRRANAPGKGLLGLPGGYHMRGETWRDAGCREVLEETGYVIYPDKIQMISMETDEYGNNLVIGYAHVDLPAPQFLTHDNEVMEIIKIKEAGDPRQWAFPRHYEAADSFFSPVIDS